MSDEFTFDSSIDGLVQHFIYLMMKKLLKKVFQHASDVTCEHEMYPERYLQINQHDKKENVTFSWSVFYDKCQGHE